MTNIEDRWRHPCQCDMCDAIDEEGWNIDAFPCNFHICLKCNKDIKKVDEFIGRKVVDYNRRMREKNK